MTYSSHLPRTLAVKRVRNIPIVKPFCEFIVLPSEFSALFQLSKQDKPLLTASGN